MSYKTILDYGQGTDPETITFTPFWVVAVWRQRYPDTSSSTDTSQISAEKIPLGVDIHPKPLILTEDCFQLNVSNNKSNHVSSLNVGLYATQDYLKLINPGDWVCAWIVNDETKYTDLIGRIEKHQQCNLFDDGLKFYGKVTTMRKQIRQDPGGKRLVRYMLAGSGFTEFDATLHYDPYLAAKEDLIARAFGKLSINISKLITDSGAGGIAGDKAVPEIVDVFLGRGVPKNLLDAGPIDTTTGTEGEFAYILPTQVGAILGKTLTSKRAGIGYADILETLVGVQEYSRRSEEPAKSFQPDGADQPGPRRYTTNRNLLGLFLPTPPAFTNKTVWNILREYVNDASNEMFCALRVNPEGAVVPTLVLRQLPFSNSGTDDFDELASGGLSRATFASIPKTKYLSLPRWEIHPIQIQSADVGRSDATRFNFVQILPVSASKSGLSMAQISALNRPIRDLPDIARHGIRPYSGTIPSYAGVGYDDSVKKWNLLAADFLMGGHMRLTGQIETRGAIVSPICIGDNVEFESVVYHIEALNHSCSISDSGVKSSSTTISVTHGMDATQSNSRIFKYAYVDGEKERSELDPQSIFFGDE